MVSLKIYTNNPLVRQKHSESAVFLDGGPESVVIAVRDRVHKGAKIINHPLSGGVLPEISPYKSLIVTDACNGNGFCTDFDSLRLIEGAAGALNKQMADVTVYDDDTLEDFQVLDLDILESAL